VLTKLLAELAEEAEHELAPAGLPEESVHVASFVQMAYGGQNFDMSIPAPPGGIGADDLAALATAFHDAHEADRGFSFRNQVPVVRGVRCLVVGDTPRPGSLAPTTPQPGPGYTDGGSAHRDVWWGDGFEQTAVRPGATVRVGERIDGPALVEEDFTVVAVAPGWSATLGDHGSWDLRRE
jgi:N-methylhydantoinase A